MNVWYVNHYAGPPSAGRGDRPLHIARAFARHGHRCILIGANRHHLQYPRTAPPARTLFHEDDLEFYLLPTGTYTGNGLGRLWNMISFGRSMASLREAVRANTLPQPDLLIYSSPHPFAWQRTQSLASTFQAATLFEVRDLWPMSLIELSGVSPFHPIIWWIRFAIRRAQAAADHVVGLVPGALKLMSNVSAERFTCIPNGIDPTQWSSNPVALPEVHRQILDRLISEQKFVIGYVGSMGPPNALEQLLRLQPAAGSPAHFVLVGDGLCRKQLEERASRNRLTFLTFLPPLHRQEVPAFLERCDACFLAWQRSALYRAGISPNKVYEYMMAAKPILHAVDAFAEPVAAARAGFCVPPSQPETLLNAIEQMRQCSPAERQAMGQRGREYVLRHHDWRVLGDRYVQLAERFGCRGHDGSRRQSRCEADA